MPATPPTPTVRSVPAGIYIPDGYQSLITFTSVPGLKVWEKALKPAPIDGGEAIDVTTMYNITWHVFRARTLKKRDAITITGAYDPDAVADLITLVNREDTITFKFPDGTTDCMYGFCQKAEFSELKEGEFPEVTLTIMPMNWDKVAHLEAGPVVTPVAGT